MEAVVYYKYSVLATWATELWNVRCRNPNQFYLRTGTPAKVRPSLNGSVLNSDIFYPSHRKLRLLRDTRDIRKKLVWRDMMHAHVDVNRVNTVKL